jgi:hypothetical protein
MKVYRAVPIFLCCAAFFWLGLEVGSGPGSRLAHQRDEAIKNTQEAIANTDRCIAVMQQTILSNRKGTEQ